MPETPSWHHGAPHWVGIKTFCLWLAVPTYWRIGESKKPGVFQNKNKTNPTKNKTKTPQEDTRRTRWDTTLSEKKSSGRSVLLHDVIAIPANRGSKWLQVARSYSARQEFHDLRSCHNPSTRNIWKVVVSCFLDQDGSKRIVEETHFIPLWPGSKPWRRWKKSPGAVFQPNQEQ